MWPAVWPGVSITLPDSLPTLTLSPSRTVSSTNGYFAGLRRRDHAAAVFLLQRRDAVGVVGVMMRHQDVGELPAVGLQRGLDRRGFRRVDRGGGAGRRVVEQHAVIVLQAAETAWFRRACWSSLDRINRSTANRD